MISDIHTFFFIWLFCAARDPCPCASVIVSVFEVGNCIPAHWLMMSSLKIDHFAADFQTSRLGYAMDVAPLYDCAMGASVSIARKSCESPSVSPGAWTPGKTASLIRTQTLDSLVEMAAQRLPPGLNRMTLLMILMSSPCFSFRNGRGRRHLGGRRGGRPAVCVHGQGAGGRGGDSEAAGLPMGCGRE